MTSNTQPGAHPPTRVWDSVDQQWPRIKELIDSATTIGTLAHKDADADSLGSSLAFALTLTAAGKQVHSLVPAPLPKLLEYLPGFELLESQPPEVDLLFTFDCATLARFGDRRQLVEKAPLVINIDHHVTSEGFGAINLIDPTAAATGQVVYQLLTALGYPISTDAATNLYAALFTDTGGFRHENTTEAALRLGAELVALGADPGWIALKSYKSRSVQQLRLEGMAIAHLQTEVEGQLIWSEVTQEMLHTVHADLQESEGVIDTLQSVNGMLIAILFKEVSDHVTRMSVRTREQYDATDLCTPFGGGGHHRAAGAEFEAPLSVAREKVLAVARQLLAQNA